MNESIAEMSRLLEEIVDWHEPREAEGGQQATADRGGRIDHGADA